MLLRLMILLPVGVVILALVVWLITGNLRYRRFALRLLTLIVAGALLIFALLVAERLMFLARG